MAALKEKPAPKPAPTAKPNYPPKLLPVGIHVVIVRLPSGTFEGSVDDRMPGPDTITLTSPTPDGLLSKLAEAYCVAKGIKPI